MTLIRITLSEVETHEQLGSSRLGRKASDVERLIVGVAGKTVPKSIWPLLCHRVSRQYYTWVRFYKGSRRVSCSTKRIWITYGKLYKETITEEQQGNKLLGSGVKKKTKTSAEYISFCSLWCIPKPTKTIHRPPGQHITHGLQSSRSLTTCWEINFNRVLALLKELRPCRHHCHNSLWQIYQGIKIEQREGQRRGPGDNFLSSISLHVPTTDPSQTTLQQRLPHMLFQVNPLISHTYLVYNNTKSSYWLEGLLMTILWSPLGSLRCQVMR